MAAPTTIVFALYPNVTQLDFTGPHQVLSLVPGAEVTTASEAGDELTSDDGLIFAGLPRLKDLEACDVICVPGGRGLTAALRDRAFVAEVRRLGRKARYVTSVCTGSLILGAAGLLQGRRAACHWAWRDLLTEFGATPDPARVVRDGNVITGGGVTAGIDFALTLAAEIAGEDAAQAIQLAIEYAPDPPFDAGRPDSAPEAAVAAVQARYDRMREARRAAVAEARAAWIAA